MTDTNLEHTLVKMYEQYRDDINLQNNPLNHHFLERTQVKYFSDRRELQIECDFAYTVKYQVNESMERILKRQASGEKPFQEEPAETTFRDTFVQGNRRMLSIYVAERDETIKAKSLAGFLGKKVKTGKTVFKFTYVISPDYEWDGKKTSLGGKTFHSTEDFLGYIKTNEEKLLELNERVELMKKAA